MKHFPSLILIGILIRPKFRIIADRDPQHWAILKQTESCAMTRDLRDQSHLWLHARMSLAVHKIKTYLKYFDFQDTEHTFLKGGGWSEAIHIMPD